MSSKLSSPSNANQPAADRTTGGTEGQARRNVGLLVAAQALGGAAPPIIVSLGGIIGQTLAGKPSLATLPVSLYHLGLALSTIPIAMLMRRIGRRNAYVIAALSSIGAGLVAATAIVQGSFLLFCVGVALAGFYGASVQSYRFAASDAVDAPQRAQAISRIMLGGLAAAIIGPQVVIWSQDAFPGVPFAGSFIGLSTLALLALGLVSRLAMPAPPPAESRAGARSLAEIAKTPRFVVAVTAGVVSYGLMSFIMTAAPMAMVGCGHTVGEAALGIQWHVLAMFGPSFFTGRLIDRFGKAAVTAVGLALIAASALLALGGLALFHFWGSLILLGLGWNLAFIGATSMITDCYTSAERAKVQALNDFLVFGTVAAASFGAGHLLQTSGWDVLNLWVQPIVAVVLVMVGLLTWLDRRQTRQGGSAA